jgi:phosphatidylinositol alpha-mannosyltransferase
MTNGRLNDREARHTPDQTDNHLLFVFDGEYALDNGVSNYIRTIGNYALDQGCAVDYLVGKTELNEPSVHAFSTSLPLTANGSRSFIPLHTSTRRIANCLDSVHPNAVHVQLPYLPTLSGKVIEQLNGGTSLVGTFHTPTPQGWLRLANKVNARLSKRAFQQFDHLFSVSGTAQAAAKEIYGVNSEVLPCPVDIGLLQGNNRSDAEKNGTTITFLGRLVARKGIGTLIDSVELLGPEAKDKLQVRIIGDGEEREAVERKVADSSLEDRVVFFGKVSERRKHELLASSDIVAYPSKGGESFGIVLVEAMASGNPIVLASDIDGYAEVLSRAPEALVARNNPYDLADRIQTIINNPQCKQAMFNSQQSIVKEFDIRSSIGPTLMQAYGFIQE